MMDSYNIQDIELNAILMSCYCNKTSNYSSLRRNNFFNGKKAQKCIRMGITIFKMFIWGGLWSDIGSEITIYGSAQVSP